MANIFNSVPATIPKRNVFRALSHSVKLSAEMGYLVPVLCQDVIPNDRFALSAAALVRFAPLVAPIMAECDVYFHAFYVPNRILWSGFETFITGSKNGKKVSDEEIPVPPVIRINDAVTANDMLTSGSSFDNDGLLPLANRSLIDYLGFQTWKVGTSFDTSKGFGYDIDLLPLRAYYKIWSDYYRDENLVDDVLPDYVDDSGFFVLTRDQNTYDYVKNFMSLRRRCWKKDYFTSALPWAQKGDDVLIPGSGGSGSIVRNSSSVGDFKMPNGQPDAGFGLETSLHSLSGGSDILSSGNNIQVRGSSSILGNLGLNLDNFSIEGGTASEGTIRELRRAFAAQRFLERRAIGGTRYSEMIPAFFGIKTSDARLQRAEWLGGYKQSVVVSQVLQTSESTDSSPLGQPGGNAVSAGAKFIFDKTFEEYGWIMVIMSVMPKADYVQGIPKKFLRRDVYDYYWPQFAHIGEQPIQNQELYFNPSGSASDLDKNEATFGYTPRYAEYRFNNNRICGDFKDSLLFWHLGRDFNSAPSLNEDFVVCKPSDRIWAVEDSPSQHLWIDVGFKIKALRPLPKYAESL